MKQSKLILPIIVIAQFCCTSLWFAGNGVMSDLILNFQLQPSDGVHLTSSVQFGFILGTLLFALLTIADKFSPSKVFLVCALLGAGFNAGIIWEGNNLYSILLLRFTTGFFLAGIYPVGMKIAADYYEKGLGKTLGFLVGALVIGTAFPHLAKDLTHSFPWKYVLILTSTLAVLGGILMSTVPDGPFRKPGKKLNISACFGVFKNRNFSAAALGYFGHMWELYAFWAFVPFILSTYQALHPTAVFSIPLWSFSVIAIGGIASVLSGFLATRLGTKKIAFTSLFLSGVCCLVSPLLFLVGSPSVFLAFLLFWGMVVVADSPLFSTLVAQNTTPEMTGTALTLVNCIGFAVTIVSIQILNLLLTSIDSTYIYTLLAIGPIIGLIALSRNKKQLG